MHSSVTKFQIKFGFIRKQNVLPSVLPPPKTCTCPLKSSNPGGSGVMVWGGISHVGKTNLKIVVGNLNGIRYRDEILAPIVLLFIRTHHFNHVFQQD
jgi:hypothetical protein